MKWKFRYLTIEADTNINLSKHYGFIYKITYCDNTYYFGKKAFKTERRAKPLKSMRKNAKRIIVKESDWRKYCGSSKLTKDKKIIKKEILKIAYSKRHLTFLETELLFCNKVLKDKRCLNENILGKFFDNVYKKD